MDGDWDEFTWDELNCRASGVVLDNRCICIADLGLWNGRKMGYKMLSNNLGSCLFVGRDCDYVEFYIDGRNNLRSNQVHHDGTNRLLFRELKSNISDATLKTFLIKLYTGTATSKDITRYSTSVGKYFT